MEPDTPDDADGSTSAYWDFKLRAGVARQGDKVVIGTNLRPANVAQGERSAVLVDLPGRSAVRVRGIWWGLTSAGMNANRKVFRQFKASRLVSGLGCLLVRCAVARRALAGPSYCFAPAAFARCILEFLCFVTRMGLFRSGVDSRQA